MFQFISNPEELKESAKKKNPPDLGGVVGPTAEIIDKLKKKQMTPKVKKNTTKITTTGKVKAKKK